MAGKPVHSSNKPSAASINERSNTWETQMSLEGSKLLKTSCVYLKKGSVMGTQGARDIGCVVEVMKLDLGCLSQGSDTVPLG